MEVLKVFGLALLILIGLRPSAQAADAPEYQVKAAMLYNVALYVEWPTQAFTATNSPLVICVLGKDSFGPLLEREVHGMTARQRSIQIRYCTQPAETLGCHILFISRSEQARLAPLLAELPEAPLLTISDAERFAARGGIIGFVPKGNRIGIQVNLEAAASAGLKIDSRLLGLAEIVHTKPEEKP